MAMTGSSPRDGANNVSLEGSPRPSRSRGGAIARGDAMVLNSCQRCLMVGQGVS
jgi:hypothetical protein